MLRIRFHKPAPGLEQFVRFYVQREAQIRGAAVVHPVPARANPMIEFIFGDSFDVLDLAQMAHRKSPSNVVVVGPQTYRRVEMQLQGNLESFVIMLQPDGLHRLFSIPMHDLTDQDYEGHSVLGSFVSQARERLGNSRSFEDRVGLVDELLLCRSFLSLSFDGVSAAAHRIIQTGGRVGIAALADRAGLGMRQFERRFIQKVGMRPKLFARIARFEAALESKARFVTRSWTDVAHDFGYYDQMHMVHDFAEFTGGTPTETLTQLETVFVEQIKTMRSGARPATAIDNPRLIL
jgi:AraC-like DNA-binding protein